MKMKLNLRAKILLGYLLIIILTGAVAYTGASSIGLAEERYGLVIEKNMPEIALIMEIRSKNVEQMAAIRAFLLYRDEKYRNEFISLDTAMEGTFKEVDQYINNDEARAFMKKANDARKAYSDICRRIMDMVIADGQSDISALLTEGKAMADNIKEISDQWIEYTDNENLTIISELKSTLETKDVIMYTTVVTAIILGTLAGLFIANIVASPIKSLTASAEAIASGNLLQPIKSYRSGDEVELLSQAFIKMQGNLKELITKVHQATQTLASSSQQLSASSQETSSGSQEMASTINQLAEGATSQAQELEHASGIINDMSDNLDSVSENTEAVASASSKVLEVSAEGLSVAEFTIDKIGEIKASTGETAELITQLGEASQRIGNIVEIIKGISGQTNLLALNAAIEAARAGEMGKGFAVVASEVRKLAEQSSVSAQEISGVIEEIQSQTRQAVDAIERNVKNVDEGVAAVNNAGSSFRSISSEVEKVAVQINEVSRAVQKMAGSSKDIVRSIESIAAVSEETAASSEEITATAEEQTAAMEEVASSAQDLARLADELQDSISIFKF